MPKKIRFIKNCDEGIVGQIINYSNPSADSLVEQRYAEYVEETSSKSAEKFNFNTREEVDAYMLLNGLKVCPYCGQRVPVNDYDLHIKHEEDIGLVLKEESDVVYVDNWNYWLNKLPEMKHGKKDKEKPNYVGFSNFIEGFVASTLPEQLEAINKGVEEFGVKKGEAQKLLTDKIKAVNTQRAKEAFETKEKIRLAKEKEDEEIRLKEEAEDEAKRKNAFEIQQKEVNEEMAINLLKDTANSKEIESYDKKDIIWNDESYYNNSWKRLKSKTQSQLVQAEKLFQVFSSLGEIVGKPQIRNNDVKTNITLIIEAMKRDKEGNAITTYKFIDDPYNRRDDGYEVNVLSKYYWVYDVVDKGIGYIVLSEKKLENNEVHTFYGTTVTVPHPKEFDNNLMCRGSANLFFAKTFESTIKPLPQKEIVPYVLKFLDDYKIDRKAYKKLMFDYIFIHPDGYIYNQTLDYMRLRHAHLLSGKYQGYPLHLWIWGGFAVGKTQELECTDNIFRETILEAGNSTPKALIPSFKGNIPEPGFILTRNRIALIDELMKMIDAARGNTRNSDDFKNQLGQLNSILEHKARSIESGNGKMFSTPTSKTIVTTNPSSCSNAIYEELKILDASTLSRPLAYVKGRAQFDFINQNKLRKCAKTHALWCKKEWENKYKNNKDIPRYPLVFAQYKELFRNVYVTVFDSCQKFTSKVDEKKEEILFQVLLGLSKEPMKSIFRGRGKHHIRLVIDGLVKFRCIFEDFSSDFEAIEKDYDDAERILVEMVKNWDYNMGIKKEDLWKTF